MPEDLNPHRFRVPRQDRSVLSIPNLSTASDLVEENRRLFAGSACSLFGRSLRDLRRNARQAAISAARRYTSGLLGIEIPSVSDSSCIVSGHQPELFHVGVWAKNFTLSGVANRTGAVPLNLVIDTDAMDSASVGIPTGTPERMRIERAPFDAFQSSRPWEEAKVIDTDRFQQFGTRISRQIFDAWGFEPLMGSAWPTTIAEGDDLHLSDQLTRLRARIERSWGLNNLELPMSRLCETEPFLWFVAALIMRLPELHSIYNDAVAEYRSAHRIRNRVRPVPDLDSSDDWLEAPFWVWREGETKRGKLFVRRTGSTVELRFEDEVFVCLPHSTEGSLTEAVNLLSQLSFRGIRLRTRALTTTLFARVCLADLFVHGIGGAKYDTMTDRICERFFGLKRPSFLTVSATLYLPFGLPTDTSDMHLQEINHRLRDLNYNPERYLGEGPKTAAAISEKRQLLAAAREMRDSNRLRGHLTREQHNRLNEIRAELRSQAESIRQKYELERAKIRSQLAANAVIRNREFPFLLYPEPLLRQFLTPLAENPIVTEE